MIMVKISPWGSPNLQYLDIGVAGQKGWETLNYRLPNVTYIVVVGIYSIVRIGKWGANMALLPLVVIL